MTDKDLLECFRTTLKVYDKALHIACIDLSCSTYESIIKEYKNKILNFAISDLREEGVFKR